MKLLVTFYDSDTDYRISAYGDKKALIKILSSLNEDYLIGYSSITEDSSPSPTV